MAEDDNHLQEAPKAEQKTAPAGFDSLETLGRIDKAEENIKKLGRDIKEIRETNRLLLVVLVVGFITMLVGFISLIDSSNGNKQATYQQLIEKIDSLKKAQ